MVLRRSCVMVQAAARACSTTPDQLYYIWPALFYSRPPRRHIALPFGTDPFPCSIVSKLKEREAATSIFARPAIADTPLLQLAGRENTWRGEGRVGGIGA